MQCLDPDTAKVLYGTTGVPTTPPDGVILAEACYRCVQNAYCSSNGTRCDWTEEFRKCFAVCSTIPDDTKPVEQNCSTLSVCRCFENPECAWCQYSNEYTFPDKTTSTVSLGRCMPRSSSNKCTGETTAAGYAGSYLSTKPADCSSVSTSDNVKDPSVGVINDKIRTIVKAVVDAITTAADFQKRLDDAGITDCRVKEIVPPATDGDTKCIIRLLVEITGTRTTDEISKDLNTAVSAEFGIDGKTETANTELAAEKTSKKRQTGSSSYLTTTTIQSAPPAGQPQPAGNLPGKQPGNQPGNNQIQGSAGYTITPLWLCTILLALVFLR
jgi:hypothetical protein